MQVPAFVGWVHKMGAANRVESVVADVSPCAVGASVRSPVAPERGMGVLRLAGRGEGIA